MGTTSRTAQNVRRLSVGIIGVAQSEQTPTETCKFPVVVIRRLCEKKAVEDFRFLVPIVVEIIKATALIIYLPSRDVTGGESNALAGF
jgi:hypothetical protein